MRQPRLSCRYDLAGLTVFCLCLITGTKWLLGLHERRNYVTHNPNQDVSYTVRCWGDTTTVQTCDFTLYWVAFISTITGWAALLLAALARWGPGS